MEQKKMSVIGKIWWVIYPVLLFIGIQLVVQFIIGFILGFIAAVNVTVDMSDSAAYFEAVTTETTDLLTKNIILMNIISQAVTIPLAVLFVVRDTKRRGLDMGKNVPTGAVSWIAIIFTFIGYTIFYNLFVAITGLNEMYPSMQESLQQLYNNNPGMVFITAAVFAPFVEEFIFRGLMFKRLRSMMPFFPAALISGIMFGVVHGNFLQGIYTAVMGFLFAYIYEKKRALIAPIIGHMSVNVTGVLLTYLVPESFLTEQNVLIATIISGVVFVGAFIGVIVKLGKLPKWQVKTISE
jgi:membrane protease YdiL (CAAX protease family)